MAMVVRSNLMAYNANRQLGMNNSAVSKNLEKLSSGFKINRAADDAAGLAISEKMKAQIKTLEQGSLNAQDGVSLIQTAEGAMTEIHDMLNRMKELTTKASSDTVVNVAADATDRGAIADELTQLSTEIARIAETTDFNGIKVLNETNAAFNIQVGESDAGAAGQNGIQLDLSKAQISALQDMGNLYGQTITVDTSADALTLMDTVKKAINSVSTARGYLGGMQNRLEHTINNIDVTAENMTNANSRIRDTDMAKQMMEYTKMNVLTQSAQAMLAQANQNPQSILQLLQ